MKHKKNTSSLTKKTPKRKKKTKGEKKMLEKICNNHLYTTQVNEESYPISYDEFIQEIIKEEDEELQEKIDDYYRSE